TCGSGAFLFAALKILEPLLDKCLDRMEDFIEDENLLRPDSVKFAVFRRVLDENEKHPNRAYFVLKSIIVNNLFGVDIMPDAVEICKLRLFLSLVAQVDADANKKNYGLEPLPDIDFNIRAGNTLVGFANETEVYQAFQGVTQARLAFDDRADDFKWKAEETARIYEHFRLQQIKEGGEIKPEDKANLQTKLRELSDELDKFIAHEYGIDEVKKPQQFADFLASHQPFHWYSEFFGIIAGGGFDVIVGNPPYVEYSKIRSTYSILSNSFNTIDCGNLYAFIIERSLTLLRDFGKLGFIVPISLTCTQRMSSLQTTLLENASALWNSNYAERPDKLFNGAEVLLTISLLTKYPSISCENWMTGLRKWKSEERSNLFALTCYYLSPERIRSYVFPKISSEIELSIIKKFWNSSDVFGNDLRLVNEDKIFYRIGGGRYWKVFTTFQPKFVLNGEESVSSRESYLYFDNEETRDIGVTILSSTLFYWYFVSTTNGRDLNPSDLKFFPLQISNIKEMSRLTLENLSHRLMEDYEQNKQEKEKLSKQTGKITYEEFYPRMSKPIIDEIDRVLAKHYGFTDEELDFIINYDIKYRMGRETED
ncbi:MAG: Eco57I restriction-modification methylase domain-containing protein, partial [Acidobacteriota bacterium]|nr:Eco57I restriction-modification methylase domain-containing protein [Acidobacteriota bacterium]